MDIRHSKIGIFFPKHKYQTQGQKRKSLVYVSKAFDHATFSIVRKKKKNIFKIFSLVHKRHETMPNIYTIRLKIITISPFFLLCMSTLLSGVCTAKVVSLVQHIKMCTR